MDIPTRRKDRVYDDLPTIGSENSPFRHIQFVPEGKISNLGEGVTRRIAATSEGSADQAAIRTRRRYVTNGSCWAWRCDSTMDSRDLWLGTGRAAMTNLVWIAVALMVIGAVMLIVGVGAPGLWIAVVTVGIALAVIDLNRRCHRPRRRAAWRTPTCWLVSRPADGIASLRTRERRSAAAHTNPGAKWYPALACCVVRDKRPDDWPFPRRDARHCHRLASRLQIPKRWSPSFSSTSSSGPSA